MQYVFDSQNYWNEKYILHVTFFLLLYQHFINFTLSSLFYYFTLFYYFYYINFNFRVWIKYIYWIIEMELWSFFERSTLGNVRQKIPLDVGTVPYLPRCSLKYRLYETSKISLQIVQNCYERNRRCRREIFRQNLNFKTRARSINF